MLKLTMYNDGKIEGLPFSHDYIEAHVRGIQAFISPNQLEPSHSFRDNNSQPRRKNNTP